MIAARLAAVLVAFAVLTTPVMAAEPQDSVNVIRKSKGRVPLRLDATLQKAAREQAQLMARAGRMSHTVGRGNDFRTRMNRLGIRNASENIGMGQPNLTAILRAWMRSRGHRKNLLDRSRTRFGLASVQDARGRIYWAMVLGG